MGIPENSIGGYEFLAITGNPEPVKAQLDLHTRAGVDGVTVGRTGKRGVKFTVQSRVDQLDLPTARGTLDQYEDLIGSVQAMTWRDCDFATEGFQVLVIDVRCVDARRLLNSCGGLNGPDADNPDQPPSLAILIADWDLLALPTSPESSPGD